MSLYFTKIFFYALFMSYFGLMQKKLKLMSVELSKVRLLPEFVGGKWGKQHFFTYFSIARPISAEELILKIKT